MRCHSVAFVGRWWESLLLDAARSIQLEFLTVVWNLCDCGVVDALLELVLVLRNFSGAAE